MTATKTKRRGKSKKNRRHEWDERYILQVYELALTGMSTVKIAKAIGKHRDTLNYWLKTHPALKEALDRARTPVGGEAKTAVGNSGERFIDYVYRRLPEELRVLWARIEHINLGPNGDADEGGPEYPDAAKRIDSLFSKHGDKQARQSIFIHAWVCSTFNTNEALRKCNISRTTLNEWENEDENFKKLLEQMKAIKKDFADGMYWRHVAAGTESIVKHAQSTLNADRGYGKQIQPALPPSQNQFNFTTVIEGLPVEIREIILDHMRSKTLPPKEITQAITEAVPNGQLGGHTG